jgi:predicted esterase
VGDLGVFIGHGTHNRSVPIQKARDAYQLLSTAGMNVSLRLYPNDHWICPKMLRDVDHWLISECHRRFEELPF